MWSKAIVITAPRFALLFSGYLVASVIIHFGVANTIAAWIVYFVTLLPFYLLCFAHGLSLVAQHRRSRVRWRPWALYPVAIAQVTVLLTSPASCYGYKQGAACYSLLQVLLTDDNFQTLQNTPAHWAAIESAFPIALLCYAIAVILFLGTLRIEPI